MPGTWGSKTTRRRPRARGAQKTAGARAPATGYAQKRARNAAAGAQRGTQETQDNIPKNFKAASKAHAAKEWHQGPGTRGEPTRRQSAEGPWPGHTVSVLLLFLRQVNWTHRLSKREPTRVAKEYSNLRLCCYFSLGGWAKSSSEQTQSAKRQTGNRGPDAGRPRNTRRPAERRRRPERGGARK